MLNDDESNEVMIFLDTVSQYSIIHSHLTTMYRERDHQLYWNLLHNVYWHGDNQEVRNLLREMRTC